MFATHSYHHHYLALLTERLLRRTLDEQRWRERCDRQLATLITRERIWARTPGALTQNLEQHCAQLREQLDLTEPALLEMKGYRCDEEREEYTRLVAYRAALLEELERARGVMERDVCARSLAG